MKVKTAEASGPVLDWMVAKHITRQHIKDAEAVLRNGGRT